VPSTQEDDVRRTKPVMAVWVVAAAVLALAGCGGGSGTGTASATIQTISPAEAADLVAEAPEGLVVLDVHPRGVRRWAPGRGGQPRLPGGRFRR
jgi:hypothetical protein